MYQEGKYSALNGDIMVRKVYFGLLGNIYILVLYPLISSPGINGIEGWNGGYGNILM